MEENHPAHFRWPQSSRLRLGRHHPVALSVMQAEAHCTQPSSPDMNTGGPKRKQGKLTENCVLQFGKLIKALALPLGAHVGIIFT